MLSEVGRITSRSARQDRTIKHAKTEQTGLAAATAHLLLLNTPAKSPRSLRSACSTGSRPQRHFWSSGSGGSGGGHLLSDCSGDGHCPVTAWRHGHLGTCSSSGLSVLLPSLCPGWAPAARTRQHCVLCTCKRWDPALFEHIMQTNHYTELL